VAEETGTVDMFPKLKQFINNTNEWKCKHLYSESPLLAEVSL